MRPTLPPPLDLWFILLIMKSLPLKPTISISDLDKLDIRVGTIEKVEDIEKSDKLVKTTVNFGEFTRTIVVGIKKERQNPQEIEGKQSLFIVNLPPREMFGIISEGMFLDIGYSNDIIPVLAIPEKKIPNGACAG